ncbi:MAG: helix-turn-helix transcriptional regulator [Desulfobacterales bacterium]|nr:helix-turn-helix transcriptional regulator [Desulfobacterales bacterium]
MELREAIGIRIKEIRIRRSLTQEELAEKMNTNPKYISSVERGKENPTLSMLENFANSLDVNVEDFFYFIHSGVLAKEKHIIIALLAKASKDQLKLIHKILSAIIE